LFSISFLTLHLCRVIQCEIAGCEEDELIVPSVLLKSVRPLCDEDVTQSDKECSDKEEIDVLSVMENTEEQIMASLKAVEQKLEQLAEKITANDARLEVSSAPKEQILQVPSEIVGISEVSSENDVPCENESHSIVLHESDTISELSSNNEVGSEIADELKSDSQVLNPQDNSTEFKNEEPLKVPCESEASVLSDSVFEVPLVPEIINDSPLEVEKEETLEFPCDGELKILFGEEEPDLEVSIEQEKLSEIINESLLEVVAECLLEVSCENRSASEVPCDKDDNVLKVLSTQEERSEVISENCLEVPTEKDAILELPRENENTLEAEEEKKNILENFEEKRDVLEEEKKNIVEDVEEMKIILEAADEKISVPTEEQEGNILEVGEVVKEDSLDAEENEEKIEKFAEEKENILKVVEEIISEVERVCSLEVPPENDKISEVPQEADSVSEIPCEIEKSTEENCYEEIEEKVASDDKKGFSEISISEVPCVVLAEAAECLRLLVEEIERMEADKTGERQVVPPAAEGAAEECADASCAQGGGGFTSYVMITQQQDKELDDADRVNVSVLDSQKVNINHTTEEEEEAARGGFLTLHLQNEVQIVSNDKTMSQVRTHLFITLLFFANQCFAFYSNIICF